MPGVLHRETYRFEKHGLSVVPPDRWMNRQAVRYVGVKVARETDNWSVIV